MSLLVIKGGDRGRGGGAFFLMGGPYVLVLGAAVTSRPCSARILNKSYGMCGQAVKTCERRHELFVKGSDTRSHTYLEYVLEKPPNPLFICFSNW